MTGGTVLQTSNASEHNSGQRNHLGATVLPSKGMAVLGYDMAMFLRNIILGGVNDGCHGLALKGHGRAWICHGHVPTEQDHGTRKKK